MRLNEFEDAHGWDKKEGVYNVAIISKLGKSYEGKGLSYKEAKLLLNRTVGGYQTDVFPDDVDATVRWHTSGEAAIMTIPSTHAEIEFWMEKDKRA